MPTWFWKIVQLGVFFGLLLWLAYVGAGAIAEQMVEQLEEEERFKQDLLNDRKL